ncbi:MAG: putative lipopolysaccharide heptosyltransferase III [Nitrospirota bacterium]
MGEVVEDREADKVKKNIFFNDVRKILIIKLRHIGDVLLTVPTIRALREAFNDAEISVLVNKGTEEMLTGNPLLNEIIVYKRDINRLSLSQRVKNEIIFVSDLRKKGFDLVVDLTSGDRPALLSFLSGARYRIGNNPKGKGFLGKRFLYTHLANVDQKRRHTVEYNLDTVREFGIDTKDKRADFYFNNEDEQYIDNFLKKNKVSKKDILVHVHPTSRWLFKTWNDKSMSEIMDYLQIKKKTRVIVTSSPEKKELDKAKKILKLCKSKPLQLLGKTSLKQLGALSSRAQLFFGVDSAPMHIAAAMNTPVIALFGPSGAFHWGPWDNQQGQGARDKGQKNAYQKKNGIQTFGTHTVIQKDWDCIPCGKDGCDGTKKSRCLDEITVESVIRIIENKLSQFAK